MLFRSGKETAHNLALRAKREGNLDMKQCFMHIKGPEILNMWLGETERQVREIFSRAREKRKEGYLPVVFIDEAESILARKATSAPETNALMPNPDSTTPTTSSSWEMARKCCSI